MYVELWYAMAKRYVELRARAHAIAVPEYTESGYTRTSVCISTANLRKKAAKVATASLNANSLVGWEFAVGVWIRIHSRGGFNPV